MASVDELASLAGAKGERFLAVDVLAGLERPLRDLVVGVVDGQVDDDVDLVVGEQVVERGVRADAVGRGERGRAIGIEVRRRDQADLRVSQGVLGVSAGDVSRPDDADTEWGHGREATASARAGVRPARAGHDVPAGPPLADRVVALSCPDAT